MIAAASYRRPGAKSTSPAHATRSTRALPTSAAHAARSTRAPNLRPRGEPSTARRARVVGSLDTHQAKSPARAEIVEMRAKGRFRLSVRDVDDEIPIDGIIGLSAI